MRKWLALLLLTTVLIDLDLYVYKKFGRPPIKPIPLKPVEPKLEIPTSPVPNKPVPREVVPQFITISPYRKSEDGTVYGDIISHSRGVPFGDSAGRGTNAHETTHGINSEIRNANQQNGKRINGFYVLNGRSVVLEEPKIKMSNVIKFVPQNLRSYRWDLYMVQQLKSWNETPTYICDEWVAYINGGACDVDDVKTGKYRGGWTDGVSGCCDFSIYAIALAMATKNDDPEYWKSYPQFRDFIIWELRYAEKIFLEGRTMTQFKWKKQDDLLLKFLQSPEAEAMRKFCREELDGAWVDIDPAVIGNTNYEGTPTIILSKGLPDS